MNLGRKFTRVPSVRMILEHIGNGIVSKRKSTTGLVSKGNSFELDYPSTRNNFERDNITE